MSRREAIKKYEGLAILLAGIAVGFGGPLALFTSEVSPSMFGVLMIGWLFWFTMWAVRGGMPRGMVR